MTYRDQLIETIRATSNHWISVEMAATMADNIIRLEPAGAKIINREAELECYLRQARDRAAMSEVELAMAKKANKK